MLLKRNKTVVIFQGAQGIGKSMQGDFLVKYFHDNGRIEQIAEITNKITWGGRFNSNLYLKVFQSIEELQHSEKTEWLNSFNTLKDITTNDYITIERKGKDCFTAPNYLDMIITSNNYGCVPLEAENRRLFIPTVVSVKDDKIEKLCRYIKSILIKENGMTEKEQQEYFRCFYAYSKENYDPNFDPLKIPKTNAMKVNSDKQMNLVYKYIKVYYIMENKEKHDIKKLIKQDLCDGVKDFMDLLDRNTDLLRDYNYTQKAINNFKTSLNNSLNTINPKFMIKILKALFDDDKYYPEETAGKHKGCKLFKITFNELVETFRKKGYIDDEELNLIFNFKRPIEYLNYSKLDIRDGDDEEIITI